jgi:hypothetical protein
MKAPKLPSFFKTSSNKQFEMPTRYYNERKERIQKSRDKVGNIQGGELEKGHFSSSWKKKTTMGSASSSLRVAVIIVILCLIAYWILKF